MSRSQDDRQSALQKMTSDQLHREIARCRAKEEERGMPAKARRAWRKAKDDAQTELESRTSSTDT